MEMIDLGSTRNPCKRNENSGGDWSSYSLILASLKARAASSKKSWWFYHLGNKEDWGAWKVGEGRIKRVEFQSLKCLS